MSDLLPNQNDSQKEYVSKREQREKEAKLRQKGKLMKNLMIWGGTVVVLALIIFGIYKAAKKEADKAPGQFFAAQSRDHIKEGATHATYNSDPPTGGWHYDTPAQTGIYDVEFKDEQLVHNLEHGHIWISYQPSLDKDSVEKLAGIAKSYGSKIIMAPRAKNDSPIAIASWEYLEKFDKVDEASIRAFIDYHRGHGPEDVPDFGFADFRGKLLLPSSTPMQ